MDTGLPDTNDLKITEPIPSRVINESELAKSIRQGNLLAFETLYDNYSPAYFGEIKRNLFKDEDSKKTLEKVFETIWNTIDKYDETKEKLFIWGFKIVKREISTQKVEILLRNIFCCHDKEALNLPKSI